jgi:hypothetical protein
MRQITLSWTTDGSGDATVFGSGSALGNVVAVDYLPGTTETGATFTLTAEGNVTTTILVKANAGTSNVRFYPRIVVNGNTDGAALTGTAGGDRTPILAAGRLKAVIASGGATKAGSAIVYIDG